MADLTSITPSEFFCEFFPGEYARAMAGRAPLEREARFRFRLDGAGSLVPGSVHNLQRPLRSGSKS